MARLSLGQFPWMTFKTNSTEARLKFDLPDIEWTIMSFFFFFNFNKFVTSKSKDVHCRVKSHRLCNGEGGEWSVNVYETSMLGTIDNRSQIFEFTNIIIRWSTTGTNFLEDFFSKARKDMWVDREEISDEH